MTEKSKSRLQDQFNALPLEEKFANLFKMEAATLGEALKYVADSSMKFVEQAGEAIKDLSSKVEAEVKKAAAAAECKTNGTEAKAEAKKPAGSAKRTPPRSKKKPI